MSGLVVFLYSLMVLAPNISFINGNPMYIELPSPGIDQMCADLIQFCACGKSGSPYVPVTAKMCSTVDPMTKKPMCIPCDDFMLQDYICKKYENCETCSSDSCRSCPQGKIGQFCDENVENELVPAITSKPNFPIKIRIPRADPFNYSPLLAQKTGCEMPQLKTAEMNCTLYDYKISCTEKCIWGYGFLDNSPTKTAQCVYRDKEWNPRLEECNRITNCDVTLVSNGWINCTIKQSNSPDECNISCSTYDEEEGGDVPEARYICSLEGNYSPQLPYCTKLSSVVGPVDGLK